jgi:hypothetical protein
MIHHMRACILAVSLGSTFFLPGCGEDNAKTAKIDGPVSTETGTMEERRARAQGLNPADAAKAAYKPSSSTRSGRGQ